MKTKFYLALSAFLFCLVTQYQVHGAKESTIEIAYVGVVPDGQPPVQLPPEASKSWWARNEGHILNNNY